MDCSKLACGWNGPTTWRRLSRMALVVVMLVAAGTGCGQADHGASPPLGDAGVAAQQDSGGSPGADVSVSDADRPDSQANATDVAVVDAGAEGDGGWDWDWDAASDAGGGGVAIDHVVPPQGPLEGNTRVSIRGLGFEAGMRVWLGSQEMSVILSGGELVGRTPPATGPGAVTLRVYRPDGAIAAQANAFEYVERLALNSVTPTRVPTNGAVEVEIRGEGFTPDIAVSFASVSSPRVTWVSPHLLRVLTPGLRRGLADVRVTTRAQSAHRVDAIEVYEPLEVVSVTPASGPVQGGQILRLAARGLTSRTQVFFGAMEADVQSTHVATGQLTVVTPPNAAGAVDLRLEHEGDSTVAQAAYFYRRDTAPTIGALRPAWGPESGGTEVEIVGEGLDAAGAEIFFGLAPAAVLERQAGRVKVLAPVGRAPESADVVLRIAGVERARLQDGWRYVKSLRVERVEPGEGPAARNTEVVLRGEGFLGVSQVRFGHLAAEFEVLSDREIRAVAPAQSPGRVSVSLEREGLRASLNNGYAYRGTLSIWGFSPARGSMAGGTYVHVRGEGFRGLLEVLVDGVAATRVRRLDDHNLYFYTPAHAPGGASVVVRAEGQTASGPWPFVYHNPVSSYGGASGGAVDGAVNVTILAMGGSPVSGAYVMLSTRADTRYQGLTDVNGQITLSGPDVLGPQTVTATAPGMSSATVQAVDAENLTLFLFPTAAPGEGEPGPAPPVARIRGRIRTMGKLSNPSDQTSYEMAVVRTTQLMPQGGNPSPGPGSVVMDGQTYEIAARVGDLAVVALCGVFHEPTQSFTPQNMGVARYLVTSDRQTYTADLDCDMALSESLRVKLINPSFAPDGPTHNMAQAFLDFGVEGLFPLPMVSRDLGDVLGVEGVPALLGPLSDVTFKLVAGSFTNDFIPFTQSMRERIVADAQGQVSPVVVMPALLPVPQPRVPASGGLVENRTISFRSQGPELADFHLVVLRNAMGMPIWTFFLGGHEQSVRLPEFPDFSFLPADQRPAPVPTGSVFLSIYSARTAGVRLENLTYQDLSSDRWSAYSAASWTVRFDPLRP